MKVRRKGGPPVKAGLAPLEYKKDGTLRKRPGRPPKRNFVKENKVEEAPKEDERAVVEKEKKMETKAVVKEMPVRRGRGRRKSVAKGEMEKEEGDEKKEEKVGKEGDEKEKGTIATKKGGRGRRKKPGRKMKTAQKEKEEKEEKQRDEERKEGNEDGTNVTEVEERDKVRQNGKEEKDEEEAEARKKNDENVVDSLRDVDFMDVKAAQKGAPEVGSALVHEPTKELNEANQEEGKSDDLFLDAPKDPFASAEEAEAVAFRADGAPLLGDALRTAVTTHIAQRY